MIRDYGIEYVGNNEILYIYLDYNSEFAKKDFKSNKKSLKKLIEEFISRNKIKFNGVKVVILVSGVIVGSLYLNNNYNKDLSKNYIVSLVKEKESFGNDDVITGEDIIIAEETYSTEKNSENSNIVVNNDSFTNDAIEEDNNNSSLNKDINEAINSDYIVNQKEVDVMVTLNRSNGEILNLKLEEYLIGVVGAEMPASFNLEALKAQAVIARTYALKAISKNKLLTDNSSTQNYKTNDELVNLWENNFNKYYDKVRSAVNVTKGEYLSFNGEYIEALYHSTSNGKTENSEYVWGNSYPYLVSVDSIYDNSNKNFIVTTFYSNDTLSNILGQTITSETIYNIVSMNESGRVDKIAIDNIIYTGVELRNLLGLRSTDFSIEVLQSGINITTKGYGHGVGMSQYGANGMANNGASYKDILNHYYRGTVIYKL